MNKKRNRLEIIKDILEVIRSKNGKIKPTHILYKSNLSHQMMEEYLAELKMKEFIREIKTERSKSYFIRIDYYKLLKTYFLSYIFINY